MKSTVNRDSYVRNQGLDSSIHHDVNDDVTPSQTERSFMNEVS